MPTAFWGERKLIPALILACMASGSGALARDAAALVLPSGGSLRYSTRGNQTVVESIPPPGTRRKAREIVLDRDTTVAPQAPVLQVRLIAEADGGVAIVTESYASKPGGLGYCRAGEEQFLRVFARGKETFRVKVQSCIENLELTERGVIWKPDILHIEWLGRSASYRVDGKGKVAEVRK